MFSKRPSVRDTMMVSLWDATVDNVRDMLLLCDGVRLWIALVALQTVRCNRPLSVKASNKNNLWHNIDNFVCERRWIKCLWEVNVPLFCDIWTFLWNDCERPPGPVCERPIMCTGLPVVNGCPRALLAPQPAPNVAKYLQKSSVIPGYSSTRYKTIISLVSLGRV